MGAMTTTLIEACCPPLLSSSLSPGQAEKLAGGFKVLGDPVRLRLLSLIAAQPGGACTCDLTGEFVLSQPTVSHHLKILLDSGLVSRERRGQYTFYRVEPERLGILRAALSTS
jgi:ArsR family transcriptional regulator, arsenate/arsenite/antimonite-responsive transcriptional repressor